MGRNGGRRKRQVVGVLTVAFGIVLLVPAAAGAAFSGFNGTVAFVAVGHGAAAIRQVDPALADGTVGGDHTATSGLTAGSVDAGPFYSPDGTHVAFSSRRAGSTWSVYVTAQAATGGSPPAAPVSQAPGSVAHDDFAPSFTDDGRAVVFNRDNRWIETALVASGPSSSCTLFAPRSGLAPASSRSGSGSRIVVDPVDPSTLAYVGSEGHIHLLTGVVPPTGAHPCPVQPHLTEVDLSAAATGSTSSSYTDAHPDWSPDGSRIILDSNRVPSRSHGSDDRARTGGRTLWFLDNPTSASPTFTPVWPDSTADAATAAAIQPVFSPDGTHIAYTQLAAQGDGGRHGGDQVDGTRTADARPTGIGDSGGQVGDGGGQVGDSGGQVGGQGKVGGQGQVGDGGGQVGGQGQVFEVAIGQLRSRAVDLSLGSGSRDNSQPDWQPALPAANTPEAPSVVLLPAAGLVVGGGVLVVRNRRRGRGMPRHRITI